MKITFLGAAKTVTGSNYLVEAAGKKFLVDCGMWQGRKELEEENFDEFDFNPVYSGSLASNPFLILFLFFHSFSIS